MCVVIDRVAQFHVVRYYSWILEDRFATAAPPINKHTRRRMKAVMRLEERSCVEAAAQGAFPDRCGTRGR